MDVTRFGRLWKSLDPPDAHLHERPAGEQEIALNRLVVGTVVLLYLSSLWLGAGIGSPYTCVIAAAYVGAGLALYLRVRRTRGRSPARRQAALCLDIAALSYAMAALGAYAAFLFFMYYWVIIGNCFRYGVRYLWLATALSTVAFAVVDRVSPTWTANPSFALGVACGLFVIPLYPHILSRKLNEVRDRLHTSNLAKSLILSAVGHELRAPLTAVAGMADLLTGACLDPVQLRAVDAVGEAARSALSEMDDLLDVSRIEAGRMPATTTTFSVRRLVEEVVNILELGALDKGLHINSYITPRTPLWVRADRHHLRKILLNVGSNAVKFTEIGSVVVTVDAGIPADRAVELWFEVADTGIGIPADAQAKIFESFVQADAEILQRYGGTGLGLTVAKQLVDLLGGTMIVASEIGEGSAFRFKIPVEEVRVTNDSDQTGGFAAIGVALVSQNPARLRPLAARIERLGAAVALTDKADQLQAILATGLAGAPRIVVVLDGQGVDAAGLAFDVRQRSGFERVPLVLLAAVRGVPPLSLRRHFVTAFDATSTDDEIRAALHLAAPPDPPAATGEAAEETMAGTATLVTEGEPAAILNPPAADRRCLRVLLAEDSLTARVVMAKLLEGAGHDVTTVSDGDQALSAITTEPFDVVVMDVDMPVITGIEVTQIIRCGAPDLASLPVIGLTTDTASEAALRAVDAGMNACLTKSAAPDKLLEAIVGVVPAQAVPSTSAPPADPRVTAISSHPQFRMGMGRQADEEEFARLASIGDPRAVAQAADAFEAEAGAIMRRLTAASAEGDEGEFRSQVDDLRAAAAIIGAGQLEALCLVCARMKCPAERERGDDLLAGISAAVERVCQDLRRRR